MYDKTSSRDWFQIQSHQWCESIMIYDPCHWHSTEISNGASRQALRVTWNWFVYYARYFSRLLQLQGTYIIISWFLFQPYDCFGFSYLIPLYLDPPLDNIQFLLTKKLKKNYNNFSFNLLTWPSYVTRLCLLTIGQSFGICEGTRCIITTTWSLPSSSPTSRFGRDSILSLNFTFSKFNIYFNSSQTLIL